MDGLCLTGEGVGATSTEGVGDGDISGVCGKACSPAFGVDPGEGVGDPPALCGEGCGPASGLEAGGTVCDPSGFSGKGCTAVSGLETGGGVVGTEGICGKACAIASRWKKSDGVGAGSWLGGKIFATPCAAEPGVRETSGRIGHNEFAERHPTAISTARAHPAVIKWFRLETNFLNMLVQYW